MPAAYKTWQVPAFSRVSLGVPGYLLLGPRSRAHAGVCKHDGPAVLGASRSRRRALPHFLAAHCQARVPKATFHSSGLVSGLQRFLGRPDRRSWQPALSLSLSHSHSCRRRPKNQRAGFFPVVSASEPSPTFSQKPGEDNAFLIDTFSVLQGMKREREGSFINTLCLKNSNPQLLRLLHSLHFPVFFSSSTEGLGLPFQRLAFKETTRR